MERGLSVMADSTNGEIKHLIVWGREFDLEILYEEYEGEDRTLAQSIALQELLARWAVVDASLDRVIRFCEDEYPKMLETISGNRVIDNIFRFVMPESLFVLRREDVRAVELLCRSRLDPEHGLSVYFENESLAGIGTGSSIF